MTGAEGLSDQERASKWLAVAADVGREFRETAAQRDRHGGSPTREIERLREVGLLTLLTPARYGGGGGNWELGYRVIREIARADGSLAHLLGYHYHFAELLRLFGAAEQRAQNLTEAARAGWFWGGAINPRDPDVALRVEGGRLLLSGRKTFCTGARVADRLIVAARHQDTERSLFVSIPANRPGILINDDWDNMGQRQAESGSVVLRDVEVNADELIGPDSPPAEPRPFTTLNTPILQHIFVNTYLGIALGALEDARAYTLTTMRPWLTSGAQAARLDPYIIEQYGVLWSVHSAAVALADAVGGAVQRAYDRGDALTARERGELAVAVATAKVVSTRVGLSVTSAMFEVMGARHQCGTGIRPLLAQHQDPQLARSGGLQDPRGRRFRAERCAAGAERLFVDPTARERARLAPRYAPPTRPSASASLD